MPTAQATGRVCLGDGTDLGHAPAASGMGAKKGTGIARDPERAEGSQSLLPHSNTLKIPSLGRKMLPQGFTDRASCSQQLCFCPGSLLAGSSACFPLRKVSCMELRAWAPCSSQDCWTGPGLGGTGDTVPPRESVDLQFPGLTSSSRHCPRSVCLCAG